VVVRKKNWMRLISLLLLGFALVLSFQESDGRTLIIPVVLAVGLLGFSFLDRFAKKKNIGEAKFDSKTGKQNVDD